MSPTDVDLFLLHFWNSLVLPGFRRRNWKSSSSTIGARAVGALGRHVENTTVTPLELFGSLSDLGASHDRSKNPSVSQTRGVPWFSIFIAVEVSKTDAWELPRFTTLGAEPSLILVSLCFFLQFEHAQHVKQCQTHIVLDRKTSNSHQFSFHFKDLKTFIKTFPARGSRHTRLEPIVSKVKIDSMICELQMNTKVMAYVKVGTVPNTKKSASRLQRTSAIRLQTCL